MQGCSGPHPCRDLGQQGEELEEKEPNSESNSEFNRRQGLIRLLVLSAWVFVFGSDKETSKFRNGKAD